MLSKKIRKTLSLTMSLSVLFYTIPMIFKPATINAAETQESNVYTSKEDIADKNDIYTGWNLIDDKWYLILEDGTYAKGLYKDNVSDRWYMLDNHTGVMITGWYKDKDSKSYYFDDSGVMVKGWFKDKNNKSYYLDIKSGAMATGWLHDINDKWYYLNNSGEMLIGWLKDENGDWYYLNDLGVMAKGWFKDNNGEWYMFHRITGKMMTGWVKDIDENWYYLNDNGGMKHDVYVDGYYLGANGAVEK